MNYQFSLAHLTVLGCTPPEVIYIASKAGYDFVGLRLIPMGVPGEAASIVDDKGMIRQTKAAFNQTGVKLLDLELARILSDKDPKAYVPAMEVAAELGARHVISSAWTMDFSDRNFIIDRYAEICDLARPFGLTVDLEFPTFSRLKTLKEATDVIYSANRPNGGILIDTLYYHFSGVSLDELATLPRNWFHFLHINDTWKNIPATKEGMIHIARDERLYVGEGCIDFETLLSQLPAIPFSIELPNAKRVKKFGYEEHARRCIETARQHLGRPKQYLEASRCHRVNA